MIRIELREKLADIEHQRWADWQKYMHSMGTKDKDGNLVIAASLVKQWERQINTSYRFLSEKEKESDREQVDRYWGVVEAELHKRGRKWQKKRRSEKR